MKTRKHYTRNAPSSKSLGSSLPCTRVLDYPDNMSDYERESRAAEAKLAAEKKMKQRSNPK